MAKDHSRMRGEYFFPFFPDISERAYTDDELANIDPPPFEYDGKKYTHYEATQAQRGLERKMRKLKRELIGYDAAESKMDFQNASIKLQRYKQLYYDFSNKAGLRYQMERTLMPGFTRSLAQKARWANAKYVEKYSKIHYNKDGTIVVTDTKSRFPATAKPFSVIDTKTKIGSQSRAIYDSSGRLNVRIDSTNHGNPKHHAFGEKGEHAHDIEYDNNGIPIMGKARELTEQERIKHRDILK